MLSIGKLEKYTSTRFAVRALLVVICAFTLALPVFLRDKSSLLYGFEAYFHLSHGTVGYVLSFFSYFFRVDIFLVAKVLPVLLGIFSLLLFFSILRGLGFKYWIVLLSSLILIFSPSFVFLFSTLTDFAFVAFLLLTVFYLLLRKKEVLALVILYLVGFFGWIHLAVALSLLLFYSLKVKRFRLFLYALPSLVLIFFSPAKNLFSFGSFVSDFGGPFGLGVFIMVLSFFGLKYFWKDKYVHFYFYLSMLLLIVFAFFNLRVLSYFNFSLSLLSALGLQVLFEHHWRSKSIKFLTLLILVLGLFISSFSYITGVVNGLPNKDVIDGLYALRDLPDGAVFSHVSRGYWVEFANKPFVSDNELLYTRDIEKATGIIDSEHITYVWVDDDMMSRVWVEGDQDLLFLLKYSDSFEFVYSNNYVGIWKFNRGVGE